MKTLKLRNIITNGSIVLLIIGFFLYGNQQLFFITYISLYLVIVLRAISMHSKKRMKLLMIFAQSLLLFLQFLFIRLIAPSAFDFSYSFKQIFGNVFSALSILFPFTLEHLFIINKHASFYLPSAEEITTFTFNQVKNAKERILSRIEEVKKLSSSISPGNLEEVLTDLPRHSSFRYINNGTLTDEYFDTAYASLDDPYMYIIISNTGSAASEIISIFTKKQYNHASLSFDGELKTIVSYNGGQRVYPPGLNQETIEFFNQKEEASIIVYRLAAKPEQKKIIIDKIKEMNSEGSAYNITGLIFTHSYKPNILFCSQFVYKMLKYADLQYFEKKDGKVKPTDFVELDYRRHLQMAYEIMLNKTG